MNKHHTIENSLVLKKSYNVQNVSLIIINLKCVLWRQFHFSNKMIIILNSCIRSTCNAQHQQSPKHHWTEYLYYKGRYCTKKCRIDHKIFILFIDGLKGRFAGCNPCLFGSSLFLGLQSLFQTELWNNSTERLYPLSKFSISAYVHHHQLNQILNKNSPRAVWVHCHGCRVVGIASPGLGEVTPRLCCLLHVKRSPCLQGKVK